MSDPPSSSSLDFWEEALALEPSEPQQHAPPRALSAATASQRVISGDSRPFTNPTSTVAQVPSKRPLDDEQDPYASATRRRYVLSPDSSEDTSPTRRTPRAGEKSRAEPSSPTAPSGAPDTTVSVSFIDSAIRTGPIDGAHSYLAGDEYRPTAFGDIGDYLRKKDKKVQTQNAQLAASAVAEGIPQIFTGLSFYINGNTKPPMEVLRKLIIQRGGIVQPYLRTKSNIDYVIAPVLTLAKFKDLAKGGRLRVVKEGFVVQCAEEGRIVDWRRWRLTPQTEGGLENFLGSQRPKLAKSEEVAMEDTKEEMDVDVTPTRERPTDTSTVAPPVAAAPAAAAGSLLRPSLPGPASRPRSTPVPTRGLSTRPRGSQLPLRQHAPRSPHPKQEQQTPVPGSPVRPNTRANMPVTSVPGLVTNLKELHQQSSTSSVGATSAALDNPRTAANSSQIDFGDLIDLAEVDLPEIETHAKEAKPVESKAEAELVPRDEPPAVAPEAVAEAKAERQTEETETVPQTEERTGEPQPPPGEVVEIETTDPDPNNPGRPEGTWSNYAVHRSNPYASRLMQTEGFREQKTAVSGTAFIDSFYQNSRLHLLSTWKAALKVLVAEARTIAGHVPRVLPPASAERVIFHVDFDAFFVSAGLASRPHLVGKPVVVCHSARGGRDSTSEIASASYEARAKGIRNGMSLGRARQLCGAELETIPYDFELYKSHSLAFYAVLLSYADELEAVSIDEALLDITGAVTACAMNPDEAGADPDPAITIAQRIRADIKEKTGCNVSIGISHNILLARLASKRAKPPASGVYHLLPEGIPEFLADLDVNELPSFGHSAKGKLQTAFGTTTCGGLLSHSRDALRRVLGPKTGDTLYGFLRGKDDRRLEPDKARKSVSAEINYAIRFANQEEADAYVMNLAGEVGKRLASIGAKGRHVTLKIMARDAEAPVEPPKFLGHGICETYNKSAPLPRYTDDGDVIGAECVKLLMGMRLDPVELRGIGIQVTKLEFGGDVGGGQSVISFAKRPGKSPVKPAPPKEEVGQDKDERERSLSPTPTRSPSAEAPPRAELVATAPPSPEPAPRGHPSSEIDPEYLAALPADLRAEVEADFRAHRAAKRELSAPAPAAVPAAPAVTRNAAAHITKQLRPKLKTQLKAGEIAELPLYSAWGRAGDRDRDREQRWSRQGTREPKSRSASLAPDEVEVIDVDDDDGEEIGGFPARELRFLGIDVDVFAALPPDVQRDVVAEERARSGRQTALFRAKTNGKAGGKGKAKAKSGRGASETPAPVVTRLTKPSLFGERSTEGVARVLARWVASGPPAEPDTRRVRTYLLKSLDAGLGGVEHVTALLRSMRALLEEAGEGEGWWAAWESLREAVDAGVRERMGAGLRV